MRKYRSPPRPNQFGVYPFDYISVKDQFDGCSAIITIGGGPGYLCRNSWDGRTCFIAGLGSIDTPENRKPPIKWKIAYIDDTYFHMYADGDTQRVANHAWSRDNLSAYPYDTSDSRTWFSMYIQDGRQTGLKAYEYDWPSSGLYALWNDDYGGLSCAWGSMDNPPLSPIFKIVTPSPYVQKFTSTDIGFQLQCCTRGDSLTGLDARVCQDRQLRGQTTACDQLMQQYCYSGDHINEPICSCFKISQQLQSNPSLAPLAISPVCVSPCTNSGYKTAGFNTQTNGGCGHACVQIMNITDQAVAQGLFQQMSCPGSLPTPAPPTPSPTPTPIPPNPFYPPTPSPTPTPTPGGDSSIGDFWRDHYEVRLATYISVPVLVMLMTYALFARSSPRSKSHSHA